jgi:peptidoglycan hydrolase-like protein with peptidoglycan-binding domain
MADFPIVQEIMTKSMCFRVHRPFRGNRPSGIMIHSNGVQGVPARSWPVRWNKLTSLKAAHAHVDDKDIVQALPWDIQGWHAGGSAQGTHLGVETSEPITDTPENFAATWDRLVWLTVHWCKLFGMTEHNVIDHHEGHLLGIASNHGDVKNDPGYTRNPAHRGQGYFTRNGKTMDDFRAAVAAALGNANPPPNPPPPNPPPTQAHATIKLGDTGDEVKLCQTRLNLHGASLAVDGIFGSLTDRAVRAFQQKSALVVDGIVEAKTWAALLADAPAPPPAETHRTIMRGDVGADVKLCQQRLNLKGAKLDVDGLFGPKTDAAVRDFQKKNKLTVDGIVGPKTWAVLLQ